MTVRKWFGSWWYLFSVGLAISFGLIAGTHWGPPKMQCYFSYFTAPQEMKGYCERAYPSIEPREG